MIYLNTYEYMIYLCLGSGQEEEDRKKEDRNHYGHAELNPKPSREYDIE